MKKYGSLLLALLALLSLSASAFAGSTTFGNDTLGYIDFASCGELFGEAQIDNTYNFATVSSNDQFSLARITVIYENCGYNSDFNAVTGYIRNQYNSKPCDDDKYNFKVLSEENTTLAGLPAFKITAEKGDLYGFCDTYSYVSYALANSSAGFVHIQVVAPKDGWKNADGSDFHPTIDELCAIIENTYTRTRP